MDLDGRWTMFVNPRLYSDIHCVSLRWVNVLLTSPDWDSAGQNRLVACA